MMKALLLTILLLFSAPTPAAEDNLTPAAVEFDNHWTIFINDLAGCQKDREKCNPAYGRINYAEFNKAEKAARRLFHHEPAK